MARIGNTDPMLLCHCWVCSHQYEQRWKHHSSVYRTIWFLRCGCCILVCWNSYLATTVLYLCKLLWLPSNIPTGHIMLRVTVNQRMAIKRTGRRYDYLLISVDSSQTSELPSEPLRRNPRKQARDFSSHFYGRSKRRTIIQITSYWSYSPSSFSSHSL